MIISKGNYLIQTGRSKAIFFARMYLYCIVQYRLTNSIRLVYHIIGISETWGGGYFINASGVGEFHRQNM